MDKKVILTIFTPTYNRVHTLPRTYESLCRQSCKDFIWLIVDDGSQDHTAQLVEQWRQQENGFEMIEDTKNQIGCPDAIIECINAKACAYIGAGRNLRDILLAVIFSFMQQGKALDFQGNPIVWETHGRQKELVITINAYLMQVLSKYKK